MNASVPLIHSDLVPFADFGTEVPERRATESGYRFTLTRNETEWTIVVGMDQRITLSGPADQKQFFPSAASMFAGPAFGDLDRWSRHQAYVSTKPGRIPIMGTLRTAEDGVSDSVVSDLDVEKLDEYLATYRSDMANDTSLILVVDGSAGSGKTTVIQDLTHRRANAWRRSLNPLVLHVESRGRVLQNLRDLLAFSLQTLRVTVTYDQVVPLVRHGLVMLAIDGFDELADPTGYQTAWAQLNELIEHTRGRATLVMAGRESFISRVRVESALPAYRRENDRMPLFSIDEVRPQDAKRWLQGLGWTNADFSLPAIEPIFERGSYALRPVFLSQFRHLKDEIQDRDEIVSDLLSFLVERMLDRESSKFTEAGSGDELPRIRRFLKRLLQEIARDLAENQVSAIPNENLRWIAEFVASGLFSPDFVDILVNRAESVAFLTPDARSGHTRFSHEQISIHFLAQESLRAITDGEIPKYVRRNIFGQEVLEGFARAAESLEIDEAHQFVTACKKQFVAFGDVDRSKRNLAALAIVVSCMVDVQFEEPLHFDNVDLGEILIPADAAPVTFSKVVVGTLYARNVDLTSIVWDNSEIVTIFADEFTVFEDGVPLPAVMELPGKTLRNPQEIKDWLRPAAPSADAKGSIASAKDVDLLKRIDRYRYFWLPENLNTVNRSARKIISDRNWERVRRVLMEKRLMVERTFWVSGHHAKFIHFRNSVDKFSENRELIFALQDG